MVSFKVTSSRLTAFDSSNELEAREGKACDAKAMFEGIVEVLLRL